MSSKPRAKLVFSSPLSTMVAMWYCDHSGNFFSLENFINVINFAIACFLISPMYTVDAFFLAGHFFLQKYSKTVMQKKMQY